MMINVLKKFLDDISYIFSTYAPDKNQSWKKSKANNSNETNVGKDMANVKAISWPRINFRLRT